jgi:hypothetical protein
MFYKKDLIKMSDIAPAWLAVGAGLIVVSLVSLLLISISVITREPVFPRSAVVKSPTPRTTVPSTARRTASPLPPIAERHPSPVLNSERTATVIRTPTAPRNIRTTPRTERTRDVCLYMVDSDGNKLRMLTDITEPIVDVAFFRDGLLVLLAYGNLIYLTKEDDDVLEYQLPATEYIIELVAFRDQLVGLSNDGRLFHFTFFDEDNYGWEPFFPDLEGIVSIHSTERGDILWVQYADYGVVYDTTGDVIARREFGGRSLHRVYGEDQNEYIDIDRSTHTGMVHSSGRGKIISNVYSGAWRDHEFVHISAEHYLQGVQKVRTIAGNLYYIIAV